MLSKSEIASKFKSDPKARWGGQGGQILTLKTLEEATAILEAMGFVKQDQLIERDYTGSNSVDFLYEGQYKSTSKGGYVQSKVWVRYNPTSKLISEQSVAEQLYGRSWWVKSMEAANAGA